jgi:hypothetical protein
MSSRFFTRCGPSLNVQTSGVPSPSARADQVTSFAADPVNVPRGTSTGHRRKRWKPQINTDGHRQSRSNASGRLQSFNSISGFVSPPGWSVSVPRGTMTSAGSSSGTVFPAGSGVYNSGLAREARPCRHAPRPRPASGAAKRTRQCSTWNIAILPPAQTLPQAESLATGDHLSQQSMNSSLPAAKKKDCESAASGPDRAAVS